MVKKQAEVQESVNFDELTVIRDENSILNKLKQSKEAPSVELTPIQPVQDPVDTVMAHNPKLNNFYVPAGIRNIGHGTVREDK